MTPEVKIEAQMRYGIIYLFTANRPFYRKMIIQRYFAREIFLTTLAVVSVLLLIGISNQFVRYLAQAAQGEIAATLVFKVVAMNLPSLLGLLLPLGLFFGIMMSLSRLYADSEMTALFACGLPYTVLVKALAVPALMATLVAGMLNLWLGPHYLYEMTRTVAEAESDLISRAIQPGRFQTSDDGKYVLYIDRMSEDSKEAYDVFVAEQETADSENFHLGVITSASGKQWRDPASGDDYIVLENGYRTQGIPGKGKYQLMSFKQYGLRVLQREAKLRVKEAAMPSQDLLLTDDRDAQAELQWRIAISLSALVLALFALVIARVQPRQGKYAKALPGILVAIIYINVLIFARGLFEENLQVPIWIGLYWVPVLGLGLGLGLLYLQTSRLRSWRLPWF
jgi:lipopolysaccharide export system permease protein